MHSEIYINPGTNPETDPVILKPKASIAFYDFVEGMVSKLGIRCSDDGSCTELFYAPVSELFKPIDESTEVIIHPLFNNGRRVATVKSDPPLERIINDEKIGAVRLLIKHSIEAEPTPE